MAQKHQMSRDLKILSASSAAMSLAMLLWDPVPVEMTSSSTMKKIRSAAQQVSIDTSLTLAG